MNDSRSYFRSVMRAISSLFFIIVTVYFLACSEGYNNNNVYDTPESALESTHDTHDSTALVSQGAASQLPVVNRPHYHTVEIKLMKFYPQELVVDRGDTVVWVNNGITAHDVTAQPEARWTSSSMPVGASWNMVVNETSDYYCSIHVVMKGKLVVK